MDQTPDIQPRALELIDKLNLKEHPEGGYYRNTYRSSYQFAPENKPGFEALRHTASAIYYLLTNQQFSAFHKLKYDELWFYHEGAPITLCILQSTDTLREITLGPDLHAGQQLQALIPAGFYFAAYLSAGEGYSLCSCVVSPGFDFQDFELADPQHLIHLFPGHAAIIKRFT